MAKVMYFLVIIGVLLGAFEFYTTITASESAPQQAAGAAMALCWVVIPYVLARAVEKLSE